MRKFNIAIVGLGFGAEFIPIYQNHPLSKLYTVCQRHKTKLDDVCSTFQIPAGYTDYEQLLEDPNVDAVHINTPIQNHAEQIIKALRAGKYVACTVPMATTIEECAEIVEKRRKDYLSARIHHF